MSSKEKEKVIDSFFSDHPAYRKDIGTGVKKGKISSKPEQGVKKTLKYNLADNAEWNSRNFAKPDADKQIGEELDKIGKDQSDMIKGQLKK